ncbi:MAG TPA: ABC transporter permease [Solirubrobacteraceae bacterium]
MGPRMLVYLYRRRLRAHLAQELLAALGVAIAVALLFAVTVADSSVEGSAGEVLHAVIGPASLQLRARGGDDFDEGMLARVERLPGVIQAAPLLEQNASVRGPGGQRATVQIAGVDLGLALLDGLAHTIPFAAFSADGIGLSEHTAATLGLSSVAAGPHPALSDPADPGAAVPGAGGPGTGGQRIVLELRGRVTPLPVDAVFDAKTLGALASAPVAVMGLARLQTLAGLPGRVTRILVQTKPGSEARVRAELGALAGPGLEVAPADQDLALLHQALHPSEQSSEFFAAICALLGFLFAFNAILLTVPERRRAIADLRLLGARNAQIVRMVLFEALCLGLLASLAGLLAGYALARGPFNQSPAYLAEAFTLGTGTVIGTSPLVLALGGGVLATCLASTLTLLDLHGGRTLDATRGSDGVWADVLGRDAQLRLALAASGVLALASATFLLWSSLSLAALMALALLCVLAVPLALALVLRAARALAARRQRQTLLPVALLSLRGSTLRSLALASTGAVALFGSGALGGARADLLRGIGSFARSYSADAAIWVNPPGAYQATSTFLPGDAAARIARVPGVSGVRSFFGGYLDLGDRRVWIIARPPGGAREVLGSQIVQGSARIASAALAAGGQIVVSRQIAAEYHTGVGGALTLPTPSGAVRMRIAATTTNLAWTPGVIFMGAADYRRYWDPAHPDPAHPDPAHPSPTPSNPAPPTSMPTALAVAVRPTADVARVREEIMRALGGTGLQTGLEVTTAPERAREIEALADAGLSRLGEIATLLTIAAILALATALASAIWQRRASLAELRLTGVRPARLRRILLLEATLLLGAGCITGAIVGVYGQAVIDGYPRNVTGFPLVTLTAGPRPLELLALVIAIVLALVAVPGFLAARVAPALALEE